MVLKGGRKVSKKIPFAYGHPQNPISKQDLFKKFRDCARYSIKPLAGEKVEKIINTLENLEEVEDMREVFNLLE